MNSTPAAPTWDLGRYRPLLKLLAWQLHRDRRLKRRFDESDLVQTTYERAVAGRDDFRGSSEGELIRWLQTILHNTLRDLVRHENAVIRTPDLEVLLDAAFAESSARLDKIIAADQSSPSAHLERQEVLLRWAEAVEKLPVDQRDVVLMRDLHELPVKEIAQRLEKTEKSVAGLLLRGRQELRQSFPDFK